LVASKRWGFRMGRIAIAFVAAEGAHLRRHKAPLGSAEGRRLALQAGWSALFAPNPPFRGAGTLRLGHMRSSWWGYLPQIRHWRERAEEVCAAKDARAKAAIDKYTTLRRAVNEYNKRLDTILSSLPELVSTAFGGSEAGAEELAASLDVAQVRDNGSVHGNAAALSTGMQRLMLG
jgi:hypothetical protein